MNDKPTPAEIAALVASIRARADAATPGPWVIERERYFGEEESDVRVKDKRGETWPIRSDGGYAEDSGYMDASDAAFIAHAREDVPTLLDLIETLTGDLAKSEARRDLAEQTIADAPHDYEDCNLRWTDVGDDRHKCTCWKAEYEVAKEALDHE